MAKADRYTSWRGACPCGGGEVTEVVIDYDKMYASTDREIACTCGGCAAAYVFVRRRDGEMLATGGGQTLTLVRAN
jgi:hypothetical protein